MKLIKLYLAGALLLLLSITSCSKKDSVTTIYQVAGIYTGTYTVDNIPSQGALYYSISIFPDGSVLTKGGIGNNTFAYATGTWTLTGSTYSATINSIGGSGTPVTQSITATYSNSGMLSAGTWKDTNNPYTTTPNTGKFSTMLRAN